MFQYSGVEKIIGLTNFDTIKVTDMNSMFSGSQVEKLDGLENWNTSNVTNMRFMFGVGTADFPTIGYTKVKELNLSSFDMSKVTNMTCMFQYLDTEKIIFPDSWTTGNNANINWMFFGSKIKEIDLSSFDTSKVTSTTDMFKDTTATFGYARTQTDADKLNASSNKPSTLTFVVK